MTSLYFSMYNAPFEFQSTGSFPHTTIV